MAARSKVDGQPAYVLHTYPFRETSLIVEVFTRDFGRLALVARGARRPRAAIRGLMMAFQPLEIAWAGKGDIPNLMKADWQGGQPLLGGEALFCGYYLNELLVSLLPRDDAHPTLFGRYTEILRQLAGEGGREAHEASLRAFEKALLKELGYGLILTQDQVGMPIQPDAAYGYQLESGPERLIDDASQRLLIRGKSLLDLENEDFSDPRSRAESKALMRHLIAHYLDGKELETRKIFKDLQEL